TESGAGLKRRRPGVAGSLKLANQVQKPNLVRYPDTRSALDCANQVREFRLELRLLAHFETSSRFGLSVGLRVDPAAGGDARSPAARTLTTSNSLVTNTPAPSVGEVARR